MSEHEFEFVGMEDWPFTAVTCRERLLAENHALRDELAGRERPARYSPDFTPLKGRTRSSSGRARTSAWTSIASAERTVTSMATLPTPCVALSAAESGRCPTASRWSRALTTES